MKEQDLAKKNSSVGSEPVPKRQSPRVWPPVRWGEWSYKSKVAVSLDDDEDELRIEDLASRGGVKVG